MPASNDLETLRKVLLVGPLLPDEGVWEVYEDTCVHCGGQAHSIHELIPRSLAPATSSRGNLYRNSGPKWKWTVSSVSST